MFVPLVTFDRDVVTAVKPASHSSVEAESGEPPAKKAHIETERIKTVKKVGWLVGWLV